MSRRTMTASSRSKRRSVRTRATSERLLVTESGSRREEAQTFWTKEIRASLRRLLHISRQHFVNHFTVDRGNVGQASRLPAPSAARRMRQLPHGSR